MNALIDELISVLENCEAHDDEIGDCLDEFANNHGHDIVIASGETRYAIVFKHDNFVLKIPRYKYENCNEDYCQAEIRAYESAKKFRVERILLPIELYHTTTTGIAIYKQPKYSFSTSDGEYVLMYNDYLNRRNAPINCAIIEKITNECKDGRRISRRWMARVLQLYGKKFCRSFEAWTIENQVNDLHNSNTGWLDNKPIILDYAGYRG
jgi:hypothetical protein